MKNTLVIGFFFLITNIIAAQTVYLTESEKDIFWQPNTQIEFSDYQDEDKEDCVKYNKKYGLLMSASIGFRGVVDIPKKKGNYDKFYIAPVFCKNCSCILTEDSLTLLVDRLAFDIAEVCARHARRELLDLRKERNTDNTYAMFFTTVKNKWEEERMAYTATVFKEILIEKKDSAYTGWRKTVDDVLQLSNDYATQPEDCYRFVAGEPIEKGYIEAKKIIGDLRNKKEEE